MEYPGRHLRPSPPSHPRRSQRHARLVLRRRSAPGPPDRRTACRGAGWRGRRSRGYRGGIDPSRRAAGVGRGGVEPSRAGAAAASGLAAGPDLRRHDQGGGGGPGARARRRGHQRRLGPPGGARARRSGRRNGCRSHRDAHAWRSPDHAARCRVRGLDRRDPGLARRVAFGGRARGVWTLPDGRGSGHRLREVARGKPSSAGPVGRTSLPGPADYGGSVP